MAKASSMNAKEASWQPHLHQLHNFPVKLPLRVVFGFHRFFNFGLELGIFLLQNASFVQGLQCKMAQVLSILDAQLFDSMDWSNNELPK